MTTETKIPEMPPEQRLNDEEIAQGLEDWVISVMNERRGGGTDGT